MRSLSIEGQQPTHPCQTQCSMPVDSWSSYSLVSALVSEDTARMVTMRPLAMRLSVSFRSPFSAATRRSKSATVETG